jgi:hypothetical protein
MRETVCCHPVPGPSAGPAKSGTPGVVQRWTRFVAGVVVLLVFAFGVIPGLQRLGPIREAHEAILRSGIDATALFYTEAEISSEAESSIRNALKYPPRDAMQISPDALASGS